MRGLGVRRKLWGKSATALSILVTKLVLIVFCFNRKLRSGSEDCDFLAVKKNIDLSLGFDSDPAAARCHEVGTVLPACPLFGHDNCFFDRRIEPGCPPAEGTVANNVVFATAHKHHVLPAVGSFVPIDVLGIFKGQIGFYPIQIFGKNVEVRITYVLLDFADSMLVVGQLTNATDGIVVFRIQIIASTNMNGHGLWVVFVSAPSFVGMNDWPKRD